MAPSVDITKSAFSLPLNRKRKAPADSSSSSNDTASVAAVPTKTVESLKAANGTNGSTETTETTENGTNGTNGTSETNVTETAVHEEIITSNVALTAQEVHETSISTETVDRSFMCSSHFRPARFPEVIGPLPFPKDLRKLVAWSDAFVTRLGWEALQAQESIEVLNVNLKAAFEVRQHLEKEKSDLQQSLNEEKDKLRTSSAENTQLQAINKALNEQHEKGVETIQGHLKKIAELEAIKFTFHSENDKLKAELAEQTKQCEEYKNRLAELGEDVEEMNARFKKWREEENEEDEVRDALNRQLQEDLRIQTDLANKNGKERDELIGKVKILKAELNSRTNELNDAMKELQRVRGEKKALAKQLAITKGENAALKAELNDYKTKENNGKIEIQKLRGLLNKAKADFETAKRDVAAANEHSKKHWRTLESIRLDGDWLLKNKGADPCEWLTMKPVCHFGASQPVLADPVICRLPTAESVILKSETAETSVEASA